MSIKFLDLNRIRTPQPPVKPPKRNGFLSEFQPFPEPPVVSEVVTPQMRPETISARRPVRPQIMQKDKEKSDWEYVFNALRRGGENLTYGTKQFFSTILPQTVASWATQAGEPPKGLPPHIDIGGTRQKLEARQQERQELYSKAKEVIPQLQEKYQRQEQKRQETLASTPELQPHPEWGEKPVTQIIKEKPGTLKNPAYWAYIFSESAAYSMTFMGTTIAVTAATGNPYLGAGAGVAATSPAQISDVYKDLIDNGATPEQASMIAPPVGTLISSIEIIGGLPVLKALLPQFSNLLTKQVRKEVVALTMKALLAKGLKTFSLTELTETLEEVTQQAIQNGVVKIFNENRAILENIPETVLRTMIASAPWGVVGGGASIINPNVGAVPSQPVAGEGIGGEGGFLKIGGEEEGKPVQGVKAELTPEEPTEAWTPVEKLPDADLWNLYLRPIERDMPQNVKDYLAKVKVEFDKRDIKLTSAISALPTPVAPERGVTPPEAAKPMTTPEVTKPTKLPYEMTKAEFVTDRARRLEDVLMVDPKKRISSEVLHERSVKDALASGWDVSPEVLKDYPDLTKALPKAEPGQPEAGLQPAMLPEVSAKEVRPVGKGKVTQISMDEQLKLDRARRAEPTDEELEAQAEYEAQVEAEGLATAISESPVAQKRIWIGKSKKGKDLYRGLDFFISLREGSFPSYFTLKQARLLKPNGNFTRYTEKGTARYNKVPRDEALDVIAEELGLSDSEELAGKIMELRETKRQLKTIPDEAVKPFTALPALITPEAPVTEAKPVEPPPPIEPPAPPVTPTEPEALIPPEPMKPARLSVVGELPATEDALRYFRVPTKGKAIARTPVIKQIVSLFDKKLLADDPIKVARILQGKLRDMSDSYQGVATAGLNSIMAKGGKPKSTKGIVTDKRVTPLENAPKGTDGKPSMHLHDVVEYSERYEMPDKYRAYFDEIRQVSRETTAMLEKELAKHDISLHKMAGESDWVYLRRVVSKVGDIEAYGKGRWKGTQKPRAYKTAEAGVEAKKPITYLDPEKELMYQLQSAYNWIIDLRVKEMLSELTTTAKARVPAKYINDLIDKTTQKVAADKLIGSYNYPSLITRASRGEVISPQTMAQIRRAFPDFADKLSALIEKGAKPKEFTALKKEFQETADRVRHDYELARSAYQAAKTQAGPRIDEGWGIYLPGKIFTTQELAGKEVLGRDILREVEKNFGYTRPGMADMATKFVGGVGGILRQTKAALDLSVQGIQTLGALGLDTMNLIKSPARLLRGRPAKPTASWISGALRGWQRLFFQKQAKAWMDKPEIKQIQLEMIEHGALLSQSEFAEATSILSKIPVAGKLYEWTGAAFTWGRNASQTYLYIGERARALYGLTDPAQIEKRLDELAEWSNLATGGLSTRAMGIGQTQQAAENIIFFSTRLNRSVFGNILHTVEGNYTGQMARDSIAGLMIAVVTFITGMALALGQKPRLNPLPESQGGDGAKFLTVKIGEGYIGIGSTYYTLARLLANIYAATQDNPKDLIKLGMENPIVRFVRSKFGPPMALGVDFITGHDYLGELTRDNLGTVAKTFGDWGIPIWAETLIEKDGFNIPSWDESTRAGAEFFGGRTVPETDWDKVKVLRQIYAESDYGKNFDDLNQAQIDQMLRVHTDLSELHEKQKAHWVETGDAFARTYDELSKSATEKRNTGLNNAAEALQSGKMAKYDYDKERSYIRPYYSGGKSMLWNFRESLDPEGVKELETHYAKSAKPEDKAMDDYSEYYSELIEKSDLPKDWDSIDAEIISFLMRYDQDTQDYILEHKDDWILDLPEPAKSIELERVKGIEDETWWDNYRGASVPKASFPSPVSQPKPKQTYKDILSGKQPDTDTWTKTPPKQTYKELLKVK